MVIDCHVHVLDAEDATLRTLLDAADRARIDKLCISSLGRQWDEFPTAERLDEAVRLGNLDILRDEEAVPEGYHSRVRELARLLSPED